MWGSSSSKSRFTSSPGSYSSSRHFAYTSVHTEDHSKDEEHLENEEYTHDDRSKLKMQLKQQDDHLDILESSVQKLNRFSLDISSELKDQNRMLDELDRDTEHAMDAMDIVTRKTQELIKKSGGVKYFSIIVCLIVILVILTMLVIYT